MGQDFSTWLQEINETVELGDFEPNYWETEFLDSIREQIAAGRDLSPKQIDCLEKIHQKATEGESYR